jgi:hypothetical protein
MIAAVLAVVVVWAAGFLPAVAVVGDAGRGLAIAPMVGAVIATVAGLVSVASGLPPALCVVGLAGLAGAAAWGQLRRTGASLRPGRVVAGQPWWLMLGLAVVLAVPLAVVARPGIDWDSQSIWAQKVSWFAEGGSRGREAFGESQAAFSHPHYPPLLPATAGVAAATTGRLDLQTAHQGVTALLVWSALCALALEIVAVGRPGARTWPVVAGLTAVAACSFGAVRLANGEADALVAVAVVAAGLGLLRPRLRSGDLVVPALACTLAVLTKNEGLASGVLIALGAVFVQWRLRAKWWLLAIPVAGAVAALAMRSWAAVPEPVLRVADESFLDRTGEVVDAVWNHLSEPATPAVLVSALVLAIPALRERWRTAVSAVVACWAVVAVSIVPLVWTYVRGPYEITWWLSTSISRTTIVAYVALIVIVGIVAGIALEAPARRPARRPGRPRGDEGD